MIKLLKETVMTKKSFFQSTALLIAAVFAVWGLVGMAQSDNETQKTFDEEEVEALETVIFDYLMENPEVIIRAVEKLQASEQIAEKERIAQAIQENSELIFSSDEALIAGNPNGDVTLVEFFDYHCGYCKSGLNNILLAIEEDPNLRVIFKEYPILNRQSETAARAAIAASEQGKYLEYHIALMQAEGLLTDDRIYGIAENVGLDVGKLKINGTPSFVIADQVYAGMLDKDQIKSIVVAARENQHGASTVN
jgi:protein-disulfide isomerase